MNIPDIEILDHLGQRVSIDSETIIYLSSTIKNNSSMNKIEGNLVFKAQDGIYSNISIGFTGKPETNQTLILQAEGFPEEASNFSVFVNLRKCLSGERYSSFGR